MPYHLLAVPILVVTAIISIIADSRGNKKLLRICKPLSTLIILATCLLALLNANANVPYTIAIAAGLALSLIGDCALTVDSDGAFLAGLVSFLLAHTVYGGTFAVMNGFHRADFLILIPLFAVSGAAYAFLYRGLGTHKIPVLIYTLVISFMLWRALAAFYGDFFSFRQALLLAVGASLFYSSDMILAFDKFHRKMPNSALPVLATYFAGQMLIALSAHYFE